MQENFRTRHYYRLVFLHSETVLWEEVVEGVTDEIACDDLYQI